MLGAHVSTQGGLATAFDRAEALGCRTMQVFTKSPGTWAARPLRDDEVRTFRSRATRSPVRPVIAHAAYLINIASPTPSLRETSIRALRVELERCEALGIAYLVLHPGSHSGAGVDVGLSNAIDALDRVHADTAGFRSRILLETSPGSGSSVCHRFADLGRVLGAVADPGRLGVCVDTCHIFAAGYDIRTAEGLESAIEELSRAVGRTAIRSWHLNDSKGELGSRLDRHQSIGQGRLGKDPFRRLVADPRFQRVPMVVELPPGPPVERSLRLLRRFARA